jgi:predicted DNA-binding protein with PD1-like motif
MEVIPDHGAIRSVMIAFRRGEDVVQGLRDYVTSSHLDTGFVVSGVGSFDICNLHYITTTGLKTADAHISLKGPIEIGSLQGTIAAGEPHLHVVVRNDADGIIYCGDLEPGSRCCYRVELGIIIMHGVKSIRRIDGQTGLIDIVNAKDMA